MVNKLKKIENYVFLTEDQHPTNNMAEQIQPSFLLANAPSCQSMRASLGCQLLKVLLETNKSGA